MQPQQGYPPYQQQPYSNPPQQSHSNNQQQGYANPPPPSGGYNQNNMYNGGNVTYTNGGGLQTTKQVPPATSGSIPSQQPPLNGYQSTYQQPPYSTSNYGAPQITSTAGTTANYHLQNPNTGFNQTSNYNQPNLPPMSSNQGPRQYQGSGDQQRPTMQPPPSNVGPPPTQNQGPPLASRAPGPQPMSNQAPLQQLSAPLQPPSPNLPTSQMQNMSLSANQQSGPYMQGPTNHGMPPQPSSNAPPQPGAYNNAPPQPGAYNNAPPQPGAYNNAPPQPGAYNNAPPQPGAYNNAPQQPGSYRPGTGPQQYPNQPAQPPAKRLDPEAMPSPIQVIEDDKMNRGGEVFKTEGRGLLPPLITTSFTAEDMGSASPRFIRCSTYNLPTTAEMAKNCQVPMSMSIKPFGKVPDGEHPPFIVDPGPDGPIRCKRCKAYMCPQFKFTDGGRRFQCVLCNAITDTPHQYFEHIDHLNNRVDKYRRAELCRGSYEFLATKDYCRNDTPPNPPAFIFAIDVSYNAMKSGYVDILCRQLHSLLDTLPKDLDMDKSAIKIGIFTYGKVLHFYNLNSSLAQPQMMVVSDVSDVFVPLQDGFLASLEESRHVINSLLDQIPEMFRDTRETELVFLPVIEAAVQALQSANCAGKLFMFHTSLPIGEAPGKLKNRDDRKLIGTDKEKNLFAPASSAYEKVAKKCVAQACCVDLFLFPNQYVDVATLGIIPQTTGGTLYKYNFFRGEVDGDRFIRDLAHDIQRDIVFDAIMRVRTSTGIRPVQFLGALYMGNTTDVELASMDCDKSIHVEIKHDDKIAEDLGAFVQVAILYTSVGGHRRLRLHNLNFSVCSQLADLYRSCETDVLINFLAKKAIKSTLVSTPTKIREELISQSSVTLATYRKHCAAPSSPGQLILPECMKLLPVYLNCLLKSDAIHSSHDITTDDRAFLRQLLLSMDIGETQVFFYPRLIPILNSSLTPDCLPPAVRCSEDRLKDNEVYLLENGINLFLWIGQSVDAVWIQNVFGVQSAAQIDIDLGNLMVLDNEDSKFVRDIIDKLQSSKNRQMKFTIIRQRDKLEPWFKHFLVEDRGTGGAASYVDFLCHMHKEIRALLT